MKIFHVLVVLVLLTQMHTGFAQERETYLLQDDWKFAKGEQPKAMNTNFDDSNWQSVSVPHDWAIAEPFDLEGNGSTAKLPWKGQGWYRRNLDIPASMKGKRLYLLFDGVMAFPKVYINGQLAGQWDYGYNSFYVDVTDFVQPGGKNVLSVHADTRPHDSRWYPGAGIYRKVQLLALPPVHVGIWGTYVTTPIIKPHYADLRIRTEIHNTNSNGDTIVVAHQVLDEEGREVASAKMQGLVPGGKKRTLEANTMIQNPVLWDVEQPHLYTVQTKVYAAGQLTDQYETQFGVRSIRFDADDGFYLNDRRVQLKGVNLHHDHGPLGAAFYPRAMERQLEIMKSMGVNAIRTSHNTAAPELLQLCDQMGLLFFNEVFDKYDAKAGITDTTDFEEFAHRNIRNFVKRDRNHPSVFIWSVGNEIGDVQWNINSGFHRLHTMLNYVNKYDPTRPTTLVCDSWESAKLRHFDYYDVHSWNYNRRYKLARQIEPNKSVIISESASTLSTRGFYEFPLPEKKTDFTKSLQVSSYDLNAPWWAEVADDDFMWQQEENYIAGEFVWTGFDYLGEPTPYANRAVQEMGMTEREASRSSYFGIVDLVGIPKDRYYLYKSYWKPEETTLHILPHWNWPDRVGEKVPVFVYTNGDCAELFINGKSQGKQCKNPKSNTSIERFRLMWKDVIYEPGTVKVVAYKNGVQLSEKSITTTGEATQLRLSADRTSIQSGGMDLSYVTIEAVDENGNVVPVAMHEIDLQVEGAGSIAGVGNGNPQSFASFQAKKVKLFYGKAMVILKAGKTSGTIRLQANLRTGSANDKQSITIEVK